MYEFAVTAALGTQHRFDDAMQLFEKISVASGVSRSCARHGPIAKMAFGLWIWGSQHGSFGELLPAAIFTSVRQCNTACEAINCDRRSLDRLLGFILTMPRKIFVAHGP